MKVTSTLTHDIGITVDDFRNMKHGHAPTMTLKDGTVVRVVFRRRDLDDVSRNGGPPEAEAGTESESRVRESPTHRKAQLNLTIAQKQALVAKIVKAGTVQDAYQLTLATGAARSSWRPWVNKWAPKATLKHVCRDCRPAKFFTKPGEYARHRAHNHQEKGA